MQNCKICGWNGGNIAPHIIHKHKISTKEYYDKFFKKENEGFCPYCKKQTRFVSIGVGYNKYCNQKCMFSSEEYREQHSINNTGHIVTKESREKISKTLMGHKMSPETLRRISLKNVGSKRSVETKLKMSQSLKGHVVSEKTRKKISDSHTGMKGISPSKETREKQSLKLMGKIVSKETREKLRNAVLKFLDRKYEIYGKKMSFRGIKEIECIENGLRPICPYKIEVDFKIIGYVVDGYIPQINLVIEFDEKHHCNFRKVEKDKMRQNEIERKLNCRFFRIKEDDWSETRESVILDFKKACNIE